MSQTVTTTCPTDAVDESELEVPDEALPPPEMQQQAFDRLRAWARRIDESYPLLYPVKRRPCRGFTLRA